jgi:hypothetical protein
MGVADDTEGKLSDSDVEAAETEVRLSFALDCGCLR